MSVCLSGSVLCMYDLTFTASFEKEQFILWMVGMMVDIGVIDWC